MCLGILTSCCLFDGHFAVCNILLLYFLIPSESTCICYCPLALNDTLEKSEVSLLFSSLIFSMSGFQKNYYYLRFNSLSGLYLVLGVMLFYFSRSTLCLYIKIKVCLLLTLENFSYII